MIDKISIMYKMMVCGFIISIIMPFFRSNYVEASDTRAMSGLVTYEFTLNLNGIPLKRNATLEICGDRSLFYHSRGTGFVVQDREGNIGDVNMRVETTNDDSKKAVLDGYFQDEFGNAVLSDLKLRKHQVREIVMMQAYCYEESMNSLQWTLSSDKKLISGHMCHKAETSYKGRNYIVWYASDIPIPMGPWKFHSLPGLIMEVFDKTGEVKFLVTELDINKGMFCPQLSDFDETVSCERITFEESKLMYKKEQSKMVRRANASLDDSQQMSLSDLNLMEKY